MSRDQIIEEADEKTRKKHEYFESTKYIGCWWEDMDFELYEAYCHSMGEDADLVWYWGEEDIKEE